MQELREASPAIVASANAAVAIALAALLVLSVPGLAQLLHAEWLPAAYDTVVRKTLIKLMFGSEIALPKLAVWVDALALWLVLFLVINVYVYRNEGVFLWSHIRKNYCARVAPSIFGSGFCATWKTLFAFVAAPYACMRLVLASWQSHHTMFTSCYITLEPEQLARYLKYLGWAISGAVAVIALVSRSGLLPS